MSSLLKPISQGDAACRAYSLEAGRAFTQILKFGLKYLGKLSSVACEVAVQPPVEFDGTLRIVEQIGLAVRSPLQGEGDGWQLHRLHPTEPPGIVDGRPRQGPLAGVLCEGVEAPRQPPIPPRSPR